MFHGAGGINVREDRDKVETWRDEELYISGQTVVWSRTGQDGVRAIIKTFTMDTAVLQVNSLLVLRFQTCPYLQL